MLLAILSRSPGLRWAYIRANRISILRGVSFMRLRFPKQTVNTEPVRPSVKVSAIHLLDRNHHPPHITHLHFRIAAARSQEF